MERYEMKPRIPLSQMGKGAKPPLQIAGKPATQCPYCGAAMFVDGVNRTDTDIVRYVVCRNPRCGKRFMSRQPPAKLVREVGSDEGEPSAEYPRVATG